VLLRRASLSKSLVLLSAILALAAATYASPRPTNAEGELLGFDRTRVLSRESAQKIASEAKRYGQQDDITVVTLEFLGFAQEALIA